MPDAGGQQGGSAVGSVDVEPQLSLHRHLGDPGQIIDDPGVGGACRCRHRHHVTAVVVAREGLAKDVSGEPMTSCGHEEFLHVEKA